MADIIVFPKENTLSALDAQACKLPVILEEDNTNTERLQKGGLVYRKNDLTDLADKINSLLTNKSLRLKLGSEGNQYVRTHYDYTKIIENMEKVLLF
jgi:glycosyltransferase involved in cell wall biosynthesis